jgi:hypothetical protein
VDELSIPCCLHINLSDDESEGGIGEHEQDAVQELLGIAAFQSDDRYDECDCRDLQVFAS